jgi:hypothetical protein
MADLKRALVIFADHDRYGHYKVIVPGVKPEEDEKVRIKIQKLLNGDDKQSTDAPKLS